MDLVINAVERGDVGALLDNLEQDVVCLTQRDRNGRTVLDLAALLGKAELIQALVGKGAEVNAHNKSAAWGHVECLKTLVAFGADHTIETRHGERPRDIAARYGKTTCADYLDCVDTRSQLSLKVKSIRDTLGDSDRISGKWNRDDKSKVTAACNEKTLWLEHHQGAPLSDIQDELRDFEERLKPYLAKLEVAQ